MRQRDTEIQQRRPVSARGFTILELMIVVSIVAILAGLGASYMRTPRDERALNASVNALSALVAQSRNRAMSTGNAVVMRIESHEPLYDLISNGGIGYGSGNSRILVFDSTTADCADREPIPLIEPRELDPLAQELPYRHAVITRVEPADDTGAIALCFTPTGRIVDPLTSRPLRNIRSSVFGGRALVEFRTVNCIDTRCTLNPDVRTMSIGFNGLTQTLATDFDLGEL